MASGRRPEHQAPPELFYNETEARKYSSNTRMIEVQQQLSERAIELLALPDDTPCMILDVGCGSGLSGECLTDLGHTWIGLDISKDMLDVAQERETEGDLLLSDMGSGVPFRAGSLMGSLVYQRCSGYVMQTNQVTVHTGDSTSSSLLSTRPWVEAQGLSCSSIQRILTS